jgi:hypothetical protein
MRIVPAWGRVLSEHGLMRRILLNDPTLYAVLTAQPGRSLRVEFSF